MKVRFLLNIVINNQKKQNFGLTVLKLLLIITLSGIIAYLLMPQFRRRQNSQMIERVAKKNLIVFSNQYNLTPLECTGKDDDNDGWVNCQAKNKNQEKITVQCSYDDKESSCQTIPE